MLHHPKVNFPTQGGPPRARFYPVFGSAFCHSSCVYPGTDVVIIFLTRVTRATYHRDDPARILARRIRLWYTVPMPHRFVAVPVEHAVGASGGFVYPQTHKEPSHSGTALRIRRACHAGRLLSITSMTVSNWSRCSGRWHPVL